MSEIDQSTYQVFLKEVKVRVRDAQLQALRKVNKELIQLHWDIGRMIIEKQETLGWGRSVVNNLSADLQNEFVGIKGFSSSNLWRMRTFYLEYKKNSNLAPLVREIGWSHNILIFEKCKVDLQREFYLKMTKKYGWTKNVLAHQIENDSYEKFLINQTNFNHTLPEKLQNQAKLAVKDEYNFDFLEIGNIHQEKELESMLISDVRKFLMEMGKDFAFIGSQYRIEIEDDEFFIDLVLYHRRLQSLIAIELKTTKFKPSHAGQMQFYLTALDEKVKLENENSSIGIIICKTKNRTVVEYTLRKTDAPIGVSGYTVSEKLPQDYHDLLPSPEEIVKRLADLS